MKKAAFVTVVILFLLSIFFSCKHDIPVPPIPSGDTVCFQNDVLPIFINNCANADGCHNAASMEEGYQLDNYSNIVSKGIKPGNAAGSKIYEVLNEDNTEKIMPRPPRSPLSEEQKSIIAKWINQGALNTSCAASCDSSNFTYSGGVAPILQANCLSCHSGDAVDGAGIALDSYDGVKLQVDYEALYPSITHTGLYPMPKNGTKLSDCKIAIIRKWIEAGAQNN